MVVDLLVLNYNGCHLLRECLPSIVEAAEGSRHEVRLCVIDNSSVDDSVSFLRREYPRVEVMVCPNEGLCSFNRAVALRRADVAILLNNDIKLDRDSIDPLVEPLLNPQNEEGSRCFFTAPQCFQFDGETYEGFKTAVGWQGGLVQATSLFAGHERVRHLPSLTASAGAALAVDCETFRQLGGFDAIYLPGRLEDLDLCFRAFMAGFHGRYIPQSVAYHRGAATFGNQFGDAGCLELAWRNTLLFQWLNLKSHRHWLPQYLWLPLRLAADLARGLVPWTHRRWAFIRAFFGAVHRFRTQGSRARRVRDLAREREFFEQFRPEALFAPYPSTMQQLKTVRRAREGVPA